VINNVAMTADWITDLSISASNAPYSLARQHSSEANRSPEAEAGRVH